MTAFAETFPMNRSRDDYHLGALLIEKAHTAVQGHVEEG